MYVTYQVPVDAQRQGHRLRRHRQHARRASTRRSPRPSCSKSGYAFAVSGKGVFVASPDKKNNGKLSLAELAESKNNPELKQVADSIAAGKDGQIETTDPFTGKDIVLTWSKHRQRRLELPDRRAGLRGARARSTDAHDAARSSAWSCCCSSASRSCFVANLLTKPIRTVTDAAERLADGDVDVKSTSSPTTRSAAWPTSFGRTSTTCARRPTAAEAIAGGDLTVEVTPRSDKDLLGNAFQRLVGDLRDDRRPRLHHRHRRHRRLAPDGRHVRRGRPRDPGDRDRDRRGRRGHQRPGPEGRARPRGGRARRRAPPAKRRARPRGRPDRRAGQGDRHRRPRRRRRGVQPPCAAWPSPPPA